MMKLKFPLLIITALILNACSTRVNPQTNNNPFILPDIPSQPSNNQGIPYPHLNEQTQIDHLGIQLARLEREMSQLQTRIQQLERQNKLKSPLIKNTLPSQRINDDKLKNAYLSNSNLNPVLEPNSVTANETRLYNQAVKYYQNNNYAAAAAVLKEADGGNGSEISRRNMYLLLQSQQRLGNCESVINIGTRYTSRFRGSEQAPDALYSIAQCQYNMQQKDIARNTWRKLIQTYPESVAAKRASIELKK